MSIARRLQDPLAELVKIDPKAIGVGQYQHDMPQKRAGREPERRGRGLRQCRRRGPQHRLPLAAHARSGLNGTIAKNIVVFREENGVFTTRRQLLKVAKLGPKAFEQCAGFLRVPESKNVLDNTGVHPESYDAAKGLLELLGATPKDARDPPAKAQCLRRGKRPPWRSASACRRCAIFKNFQSPGATRATNCPRPSCARMCWTSGLKARHGAHRHGAQRHRLRRVRGYRRASGRSGPFPQVCNKFIKHPSEAVAVGDVVRFVVLDVDEKKHRISLSMKQITRNKEARGHAAACSDLSSFPIAAVLPLLGQGVGDEAEKTFSVSAVGWMLWGAGTCSPGRRSSPADRTPGRQTAHREKGSCVRSHFP